MLKMWVFVLLIEGKVPEAFASDSEAHCRQTMARMLYVYKAKEIEATGACYVKVARESDLTGPVRR